MGTIYSCTDKHVIYLKNNYTGSVWLRFPYPQDAQSLLYEARGIAIKCTWAHSMVTLPQFPSLHSHSPLMTNRRVKYIQGSVPSLERMQIPEILIRR